MLCPHCQTGLTRRERAGYQCGACGARFALDPKDNALGLHDLRLRRLIDEVSDGGRLAYTVEQLWYAAARVRRAVARAGRGRRVEHRVPTAMPVPLAVFQRTVVERWVRVYGPPAGLIDADRTSLVDRTALERTGPAGRADPTVPGGPVLALLCADRAVLACLDANQVPQRSRVAAIHEATAAPPGVPVALLHDVSVVGYRWAVAARAGLIGRLIMDVGPRPATVMHSADALRLHDAAPSGDGLAVLRTAGTLQPPELDWLGEGWWSPIAAVRPATLVAWVETAAERVDPDHRVAATVGFLTWPARR